jgi:hypothetical protein
MPLLKSIWAGSCSEQVETRDSGPHFCEHTITLLSDSRADADKSLRLVVAATFTCLQKFVSFRFHRQVIIQVVSESSAEAGVVVMSLSYD